MVLKFWGKKCTYGQSPPQTFCPLLLWLWHELLPGLGPFPFFWPCCAAFGILVPWLGTEPVSPVLGAWSLNLWTLCLSFRDSGTLGEAGYQRWQGEKEGSYVLFLIHCQCSWFYILATVYRVWGEVSIIIPILQMKKLRLKKVYFSPSKTILMNFK